MFWICKIFRGLISFSEEQIEYLLKNPSSVFVWEGLLSKGAEKLTRPARLTALLIGYSGQIN
jgi:hypothetical protein